MQWVEVTGRTVEEAKSAALDQLGVDEADAEFEVVEEPKTGLFGRMRSEARVRARVRPSTPRAKEERRGGRRKPKPASERAATNGDPAPEADEDAQRPTREVKKRSDVRDDDDMVPLTTQAEAAREFLAGVVARFGTTATIEVRPIDEETVEVALEGDDLGLLIGPKGATLTALQDLARTVVQRKTGARSGRLLIDVSGYRARRRDALERFTRQVADEVKASGVRRVLEPMGAPDRKVVHDTANDVQGVTTVSEGEEPRRRVVIMPE
jgi:spoIIIJ-associated protein